MPSRDKELRRPREASSDASLWSDDLNDTFAHIITPPIVLQDLASPLRPSPNHQQSNTASNPITPSDIITRPSTKLPALELNLFSSDPSSSSTSRQAPSSFDFEVAAANDPWSQPDLKATQYQREEWLIAVGQNQPRDLVQDYIPSMHADQNTSPRNSFNCRTSINADANGASSKMTLTAAARVQSDASTTSISKRGRSSLLDQLDRICSSPSHHGSSPRTNDHASSQAGPSTVRQPLRPITSIINNGKNNAKVSNKDSDDRAAFDKLSMSSPPSSQPVSHITLIQDMPPEQQAIYHRLAFGNSLSQSSTPVNVGTTVRGTRGKTWQTTWNDNDVDGVQDSNSAAGPSSRLNATSSTHIGSDVRKAAGSNSTSTARGHKVSSSTTGARKVSRASKTRSSTGSGTSSSRDRSRFFTARTARGAWRGRGRGR
ncbi:uncharacterized protein MEPE_05238 [Melanopsichium pennsylvanicum]|uniref:Uncharacterized protein n=2 Tax=Melanopsichium pennsylvanicum TaxID=63383 RepID=A0AAJ4XP31_9BASI|nr:hypothetical protein BN887_05473 [Melanopsichium pennsylvanicum 4]SNX86529.1 uncharacterized protein MEPE_05238 [Melanopsichium pennsylvanicum]